MAGEIGRMIMAVLVMGLVLAGIGIFIGGFAIGYPGTAQNVSSSNFTMFNKTAELSQLAGNVSETVQSQQTSGVDIMNIPFMIITGAYQTVIMLFSLGDIMISLVSGIGIIAASVGISLGWAIGIVYTIIIVTIAFALLAMLMKWEVL